jgi:acetylglutamate kinase
VTTAVVKYGGHAMSTPDAFARAVLGLRATGVHVVVVHGGGPQISAMLDRLGIATEFRAGLRVTTPEAMRVVRMVLHGVVNRDIVGAFNALGEPCAVGLSGEDAGLFTAARHAPAGPDGAPVDLGLVGEAASVDPSIIAELLAAGRVPVVAPVAPDASGQPHNLNADTAAAALAVAMRADALVMLTDVAGVYRAWPDPDTLIGAADAAELEALMPTLDGGMIPKIAACLHAVRGGVGAAHVVDGRATAWTGVLTGAPVGTTVTAAPLAVAR